MPNILMPPITAFASGIHRKVLSGNCSRTMTFSAYPSRSIWSPFRTCSNTTLLVILSPRRPPHTSSFFCEEALIFSTTAGTA
ncbi:hypothetical protein [uncultured Chryseobacterium sp.]|uniref:hypothetical protein n=1 Tax=uncultured Chryseobacterium sp. TaxID=259322 RepID=UPI0025F9BD58|nr:hypothetical protein [uncultured Chryseobacterium sp.]